MKSQLRWQPVLYGRTRRADRWWRVRPYDVDIGWLNALVLAGTGGGEGLADGPRFLLARRGQVVLVGVACRAALLSETMNSDGSRPLYCFAGWLSKDVGAAAPQLEALEELWLPWATAVYEAWMPLDWDRHPTDLADAHEPPFGGPPWPAESAVLPGPVDLGSVRDPSNRTAHGRPMVVSIETRAVAWRQLFAGPGDFALAVGPLTSFPDPNGVLTHLAMAGDAGKTGADEAVVKSAAGVPRPLHDESLPAEQVPTGQPPAGRPAPTDPERAESPPDDRPPAGAAPRPVGDNRPQQPAGANWRPRQAGGMLRKVGQAFRSLTGVPESPREDGPDEPTKPSTPSAGPITRGPAKDLDYWRREEAQPPLEAGPHKPVPPAEDEP